MRKWLLRALAACALLLAALVVGYAVHARLTLAELQPWHRLHLREEFHAGGTVRTFEEYLRLEDRLFAEMHARLRPDPYVLGRYHPGSVPARLALETPFNRSSVLSPPGTPRGAVLLVHGLSDSPYSMRALGETFLALGYHVVVLRLPGHGTIPAGIRDATWQDWMAAVELAAKDTAARAPGKPFLAAGYSTGAVLVTLYAVRALTDASLPRPHRLYLVSPAIGISGFSSLTRVIAGLSFLPYFDRSAWLDVLPEYDPYKYNSFPVNAGKQIYLLTRALQAALSGATDRLGEMPRILVFQSLVDATVSATDVVQNLLGRLPARGHELVVFDVNRSEIVQGLLAPGPVAALARLRASTDLPFAVTVVGNQAPDSRQIAAYRREPGSREVQVVPLALSWPAGVFSLSHVALPYPVDDPVYGLVPGEGPGPRFPLGAFAARGENGALVVPLGMLARLRCNPFFVVIREKVTESCGGE
ncbi:MAG TPA: alpha/beta fold hydrolase [Candidatus Polarisedimenticolaceae bacterium]|nr:alpha/beta fold hydrolase [Candidatus Polarisedimenticolaceae bacterium]